MARLRRVNSGSGHSYTFDGETVKGVTYAMDKGVPKPALIYWAAEQTAIAAVEQDEWRTMKPYAATKWLIDARKRSSHPRAARGTLIHHYAEQLMRGEEIEPEEATRGHVDACIKFLRDFAVEPIWLETTVACTYTETKYAGTLDLIALIGGQRWLLDWKTGKGVYGDTALQLAAYRYCDLALVNGEEVEMLEVDRCGVVHLTDDGYELRPITAEKPQWHAFLYAIQVAKFLETADSLVGASVSPPEVAE